MNRTLRKQHARIWIVLWPLLIIGILIAISLRGESPREIPTLTRGVSD